MTSSQHLQDSPFVQLISLDGDVRLYRDWLPVDAADLYLKQFTEGLAWQQSVIRLYGSERAVPRLTAWYGDPGCSYRYSGTRFEPLPWTAELRDLREQLSITLGQPFNSVLANRYRHGQDSVAWHSDDEPELGRNPVIASISLGETRRFTLKHKTRKDISPLAVDLSHGSLLVMAGLTQHHWLHQISKTRRPVGERINLTFRFINQ